MSDTPVEMEAVLEERKRIGFDIAPTIGMKEQWKGVPTIEISNELFTKTPKAEAPPAAKKGRKKTIPPSFRIEKGIFKITFP